LYESHADFVRAIFECVTFVAASVGYVTPFDTVAADCVETAQRTLQVYQGPVIPGQSPVRQEL